MKNEGVPTGESQMKPYLNSVEVGAYLGVTDRTIRNWVGQGVFPRPIRIGGVVRWRRVDVDACMMAAAARAGAEPRPVSGKIVIEAAQGDVCEWRIDKPGVV